MRIIYSDCVSSNIYPVCQAHAQHYIVICGLYDPTVFPHYLVNGRIFEKKKY
jgi:hypothetical protein